MTTLKGLYPDNHKSSSEIRWEGFSLSMKLAIMKFYGVTCKFLRVFLGEHKGYVGPWFSL